MNTRLMNLWLAMGLALILSQSTHAAPITEPAKEAKIGLVTGTVRDASTNEIMPGAVVTFAPIANAEQKKYVSTTAKGQFSIPETPYGEYSIEITFMGYIPYVGKFEVGNANVSLGDIKMEQDAKKIDAVVVEGMAMRTSQKGDTLVYNAAAFKVAKDADTEDLLAKMPGITVEGGKVEAHGQEVKKVLVDGKEFFGGDVNAAIKNLPAEAIENISVYQKLSDQAEFSGVDDGESYRAINITTKKGMNRGIFGKINGGYGTDDRYKVGASINLFKDQTRLTFTGMANNVNEQSFSIDDMVGAYGGRGGFIGRASGVSTNKNLGLNYSDEWGKKFKFSGNYNFSNTQNQTNTITDRAYFMNQAGDGYQQYDGIRNRASTNYSHRFGARIEYKINDNNNLMMRPNVSFQSNNSGNSDTSATKMISSLALEDALMNLFKSTSTSLSTGYNISNSIIYMHKFGQKKGRTLSVNLDGSINKNTGDNNQYSMTRYYDPLIESILDQYVDNRSSGYRLSGRLSYAEPISPKSQILAEYNISYNYSDIDRRSYMLPEEIFIDSLSNKYNSGYLTQRIGPGYRYNTSKVTAVANVSYQNATLAGDQTFPTIVNSTTDKRFQNIVYSGMLNVKFTPNNTLRTDIRSSTNNPSVTQLQDVLDVSNPLFVTQGNPNLRPTYTHSLMMNYVRANVSKGSTFIAMLGGSTQSNSISSSVERAEVNGYEVKDANGNIITTLNRGGQYSRPVNMDGYWNMSAMISYGTPVKFLKSNLNLNLRTSLNSMPTIYNLIKSTTNSVNYSAGATLGSNISPNLDFRFYYNVGYNVASNKIRINSNNKYVNQSASGNIKWTTWAGITLQANARYTKYTGITNKFIEDYLIVNATIGKKIFKGQRGEVNIGVNDLLNQDRGFSRSVSENYIENVSSNTIGRYFSINLIYNLRSFGAGASQSQGQRMGPGGGNMRVMGGGMMMGGGHPDMLND